MSEPIHSLSRPQEGTGKQRYAVLFPGRIARRCNGWIDVPGTVGNVSTFFVAEGNYVSGEKAE